MSVPWFTYDDPAERHAVKTARQQRRELIHRRIGKGIVGFHHTLRVPYPPLRFRGKDHSQRPEFSTKRLGRLRGPGGGGVQGEMQRLAGRLASA